LKARRDVRTRLAETDEPDAMFHASTRPPGLVQLSKSAGADSLLRE